jgi:hypothetical protein
VGILAQRLDRMRVRVQLPAAGIAAELHDRTEVDLSFAAGRYRRCSERDLEWQLATIAKLLWAQRMKEYYAALSEAFGETITKESSPISPRDQHFHAARADLLAEGASSDGRIYVTCRGMQTWTVRIAKASIRVLDEDEFAVRAREAAAALIADQFAKIRTLKDRFYS